MMARVLRLDEHVATHVGCVRSANEDSLLALVRVGVWVVADGMGGHKNGKYASAKVVEAVEAATIPEAMSHACDALASAIHRANDEIFTEATAAGEQMGSTVVSLIIRDREFAILWAGDSRAYLYRDGQLHQLTVDHTQVQQMIDRGLLSPDQADGHPMGHVLARAVGVQDTLVLDAISDTALPGDIFLLCSDGLHGVVKEVEIVAMLDEHGQHSAEALLELCLERGAPDNVTVAIVSTSEPTTLNISSSLETQ